MLVVSFLQEIADEYGMPETEIEPEALSALRRLEWTGNVRELHNVIERLIIMSNGKIKEQDVLDFAVPHRKSSRSQTVYEDFDKFQDFKDHIEREFIIKKLEQHNWNISKTAEAIGIQRSHLYNKMDKYGIERKDDKGQGGRKRNKRNSKAIFFQELSPYFCVLSCVLIKG